MQCVVIRTVGRFPAVGLHVLPGPDGAHDVICEDRRHRGNAEAGGQRRRGE